MSVRKFKSVEEMPSARPKQPLDPDNLKIACELSELAYALHPWRFEPGLRKFRSVEEADLARRQWQKQQLRRPAAID
ncbi:MAG: hypothetical protein K0U98_00450 [Deltaproteobacteria bacterium]|nr:hypothetical protein [Deltaproteobacteria bacterium]